MRSDWYLADVPQRKNKLWTKEEDETILKMRSSHFDFEDIIKAFGGSVTINQIKNRLRLTKAAHHKLCFRCGRPLEPSDTKSKKPNRRLYLCVHCKKETQEYKQLLYERNRNSGFCGKCGKRKPIPGKDTCPHCLSSTYRRKLSKNVTTC